MSYTINKEFMLAANNSGVQIQLIIVSAKGIPQSGNLGISFNTFPATYNPHIASIILVENDSTIPHHLSNIKKKHRIISVLPSRFQ